MIWLLLLLGWVIVSIWYGLAGLGRKHYRSPWWEWLFAPPVLLIALIVGILTRWKK